MSNMKSCLSQLELLASENTGDLALRFKLSARLQQLAHSVATPTQIMQHYGYMHTEQVVAKIAADLDLFTILAESQDSMKVDKIALRTGADASLLGLQT